MIGHKWRPEVDGMMGQSRYDMYLVETPRRFQKSQGPYSGCTFLRHQEHDDATVVIAALKQQFPEVQGANNDDIWSATRNLQDAVKSLAGQCASKEVRLGYHLVIVVGSLNSSSSRRLKEVANARGVAGYLIDGPEEIDPEWLAGRQRIGVTAPEILVRRVVDRAPQEVPLGDISLLTRTEVSQTMGAEEGVSFPLPKEPTSPGRPKENPGREHRTALPPTKCNMVNAIDNHAKDAPQSRRRAALSQLSRWYPLSPSPAY